MMSNDLPFEEGGHLRVEAVSLAARLINNQIDFFVGIRELAEIGATLSLSPEGIMLPIYGIASQMDAFPIETARSFYARDYLAEIDDEMKAFKLQFEPVAKLCCQEIVECWGK